MAQSVPTYWFIFGPLKLTYLFWYRQAIYFHLKVNKMTRPKEAKYWCNTQLLYRIEGVIFPEKINDEKALKRSRHPQATKRKRVLLLLVTWRIIPVSSQDHPHLVAIYKPFKLFGRGGSHNPILRGPLQTDDSPW